MRRTIENLAGWLLGRPTGKHRATTPRGVKCARAPRGVLPLKPPPQAYVASERHGAGRRRLLIVRSRHG